MMIKKACETYRHIITNEVMIVKGKWYYVYRERKTSYEIKNENGLKTWLSKDLFQGRC